MNIVYLGQHSILEYDELRLFHSLGHDVFSIGSYIDPANPIDDKRPAIAGMTFHEELAALCPDHDAAKAHLPDEVIDWADVIMAAAYPEKFIAADWDRIKGKRVIWRTIGQSNPDLEGFMRHYGGLEIIRYSPAEKRAFEKLGSFAGEDAMIRFAKDPADWYGWTGDDLVVGNITQDMLGRDEFTNYRFWRDATAGLPTRPAGPRSELLPGGIGTLDYETMRGYLRAIRCYLWTGTQPASYTLGLVEAMMTGVPIVSIGPSRMWLPDLLEGQEFVPQSSDDPHEAAGRLRHLLASEDDAAYYSDTVRRVAVAMFGVETIAPQWTDVLGRVAVPA